MTVDPDKWLEENGGRMASPGLRGQMEERGFFGNFAHGLTSNEPTEGVGGWLGRGALPMIGGGLGAAGGFVGGVGVGSVPGAGIGGAAGESLRQAIVSAVNPQERFGQTAGGALDIVGDVAISGALSAGGQKGGEMISKGAGAAYRSIAPQVSAMASKVPEKFTKAAVDGRLKGAPSVEDAGRLYGELAKKYGLKSLDDHLYEATGKELNITGADFAKIAERVAKKTRKGTATLQDMMWGRQAVQKIKESPRLGRDEFAGVARQHGDAQQLWDQALEKAIPGYADVRRTYFNAIGRDKMTEWLPRNKTGGPDVLRSLAATGTGATMLGSGNPAGVALPLMVSPRVNYGIISALNEGGPLAAEAIKRSGPLFRPAAEKAMEAMSPGVAHAADQPMEAPPVFAPLPGLEQQSQTIQMEPVSITGGGGSQEAERRPEGRRGGLNLQPIRTTATPEEIEAMEEERERQRAIRWQQQQMARMR